MSLLNDIAADLTENSHILKRIAQPVAFIDKVIYRAKQDETFFTADDIQCLEANRNNLAYIVSYVLIKTVANSKESINLKHTADFNPFADYRIPASLMQNTSGESYTKKLLAQTSSYLYNEFSASRKASPVFRSELLSKGISCSDFPGRLRFKETFSILESSPESRSLDSFLTTSKHLLIIGEGGIGKTTFLYSCLEKYHKDKSYSSVPLYLKLSDCSTSTDHQYMIQNALQKKINFTVNGHEYISFKDFRDEFAKPCPKNALPEYTLLLDGFNEITPMDFGEVRRAISKEIAELLTFPNLRIILTSRENEFYHLPLSSFEIIRANGIEEDDVIRFLQPICTPGQLESLRTNTTLMQYLRIPLFLLMYANSTHTDAESPQNRGSILFSYFNGRQAFYTEKLNAEEKNTREAYYMVSVLLDFILPDLGYYMKSRNVFQITEEQLFDLTKTAVASAKRFVGLNSDAYRHYEQRPGSLKRALALFTDKLDDEDILSLLSDLLCVILSDANRNLSFAHQYIRDYFSALYCVRELPFHSPHLYLW